MRRIALFVTIGIILVVQSVYAQKEVNLKPKTPQEWKDYLQFRRNEVLQELYEFKPAAKSDIENAQGYAVFINFGMKVLLVGTGSGRGIARDNKTGKDVYMRMAQAGVGLGVGIKDFRMVFIFENRKVLETFVKGGWNFGTDADAALKNEEGGAAASGSIRVAPGLRVYQLTKNGLALNAMVNGTKYWVDKKVNPEE